MKVFPRSGMLRSLVVMDIQCAKHERPEANCAGCAFVQQAEKEAEGLRAKRAELHKRIKAEIKKGAVAILNFG
jgi:hypothetical protein